MAEPYSLGAQIFGDQDPFTKPEPNAIRRRTVSVGEDPYKGNWLAETGRSIAARTAADWRYAPEVIGRYAFGDEEGAQEVAGRWQQRLQRAQDLGPEVQDFSQVNDVGSALSATGYQVASLVPDLAMAATGGGLAGVGAKGLMRRAAVSSIADTVENRAGAVAAREAAGRIARREAMLGAAGDAKAVSGAIRVANAQVSEAARESAMKQAALIAGRTPRVVKRIDAAGTAGFRTGAALTGIPTLSEQNVERYADADTTSADAAKLLAGTAAAASLQAFPLERLAGRFGREAGAEIAKRGERFLTRAGKEFGKQGAAEGTQEGAQQALQLASMAWMDENMDVFTKPDENGQTGMDSIAQNAMAGFLLGGLLGSGAETVRSSGGLLRDAGGATRDAYVRLRDATKARLAEAAEKARTTAANRRKAGEPMDDDVPADGGGRRGLGAIFGEALDTLGGMATQAKDSVAARFANHSRSQMDDEAVDSFVQDMFDGDGKRMPGMWRPIDASPYEYATPTQRAAMAFIDESRIPAGQEQAVADVMGRVFDGTASAEDRDIVSAWRDSGVIKPSGYVAITTLGVERGGLAAEAAKENASEYDVRQQRAAGGNMFDSAGGDSAMSEAVRAAYAKERQEALEAGDSEVGEDGLLESYGEDAADSGWEQGVSETDTPERPVGTDADRFMEAEGIVRRAEQDLAALEAEPESALRNSNVRRAQAVLDGARKDADAAFTETKARLFGTRTINQKYGKNIFVRNDKHPSAYDSKLQEPGRVELVQRGEHKLNNGRVIATRLSVDIGSIAIGDWGANPDRYANVPQNKRMFVGMANAIRDLRSIGYEINPETITRGAVTNKNGERIATITPNEAKELRALITEAPKARPRTTIPRADVRSGPYIEFGADDRVQEQGSELAFDAPEAEQRGAGPLPIGPFGGAPSQEVAFAVSGDGDFDQAELDDQLSFRIGAVTELARQLGVDYDTIERIDAPGGKASYRLKGDGSSRRLYRGVVTLRGGRKERALVPVTLIGYDNGDPARVGANGKRVTTHRQNVERGRWLSKNRGRENGVYWRPEETKQNTAAAAEAWKAGRKRDFDEAKSTIYELLPELWRGDSALGVALTSALDNNDFDGLGAVRKYDKGFEVVAAVLEHVAVKRAAAMAEARAVARTKGNRRTSRDDVPAGGGMTPRESKFVAAVTALMDSSSREFPALERALHRRQDRMAGRDPGPQEMTRDMIAQAAASGAERGRLDARRQAQIEQETGNDSPSARESALRAALRSSPAPAPVAPQRRDDVGPDVADVPETIRPARPQTTKPDAGPTERGRTSVATAPQGGETRVRGLATPIGKRVAAAKKESKARALGAYNALLGTLGVSNPSESDAWADRLLDALLGPETIIARGEGRAPTDSRAEYEKALRAAGLGAPKHEGPVAQTRTRSEAWVRQAVAAGVKEANENLATAHAAAGKDGPPPTITTDQKNILRMRALERYRAGVAARNEALNAETPKNRTKTYGGNTLTFAFAKDGTGKKRLSKANEEQRLRDDVQDELVAASKAAVGDDNVEDWGDAEWRAHYKQIEAEAIREIASMAPEFVAEYKAGRLRDIHTHLRDLGVTTAGSDADSKAFVHAVIARATVDAKNPTAALRNTILSARSDVTRWKLLLAAADNNQVSNEAWMYVFGMSEYAAKTALGRASLPRALKERFGTVSHAKKWDRMLRDIADGHDSVAAAAAVLASRPYATASDRAMLELMAKSETLSNVNVITLDADDEQTFAYSARRNAVVVPSPTSFAGSLKEQLRGAPPAKVFIHEATHALTWYGEANNEPARRDLQSLLDHVRANMRANGYAIDTIYGLQDTQEFLAEGFSNPRIQAALRQIPALGTSTYKTAWEEFKGVVRRILKALNFDVSDSALDELLTIGARLGSESKTVIQRKKGEQESDIQHDEINAGAESASSASGPHNLKAEQKMLNEVLQALGIDEPISLRAHPKAAPDRKLGGDYRWSTGVIRISPFLHGAERVEVLMHELGHHIVWATVAKHAGLSKAERGKMSLADGLNALEKADPKLFKALKADFDAWNASGRPNAAPVHRSLTMTSLNGTRVFKNDDAAFHEWLADNIARALTQQRKPIGIVEKFFAGIAKQLRAAWQVLTAAPNMRPAKSVDKWVRDMFKAEATFVKAATGASVPGAAAEASVRASAHNARPDIGIHDEHAFETWMKAQKVFIKEVLPDDERKILDRAFGRDVVVQQLRKAFDKLATEAKADGRADEAEMYRRFVREADDSRTHIESRIALGYLGWKMGVFEPGSQAKSSFMTVDQDLLAIFGIAGETDLAVRVLEDIDNGRIEKLRKRNDKYSVRDLEARSRGTRQKALNWLNRTLEDNPVSSFAAKFWTSQYQRLRDTSVPALQHIAALIQRPQGMTSEDQDRGLNPAIRLKLARVHTQVHKAVKDLDDSQRKHVLDLLQRAVKTDDPAYLKKSAAIRKAVDELRAVTKEQRTYLIEAGVLDPKQDIEDYWPVTLSIIDEDAKTKLFNIYNQPEKFEAAIRDFFGSYADEKGGKGGKARADLPPVPQNVLDFFARRRSKSGSKAAETNASIIEAFKSGNIPALKKHIEKANTRLAANDYTQDTVEFIELEIRYATARIKQLQDAGKGGAPSIDIEAAASADREWVPDTESKFEDLVQRLVDMAADVDGEQRVGARETEVDPAFRGKNRRVSSFVYKLGDDKDRHALAKLQSKDIDEVFARHFAPAIRNAEYTRRFGGGKKNRDKLDALLADAKKQGARKEDLELAENAIKAAVGTYGLDGSPTLAAISSGLADKLSGPKTKATVQGLQAYQNARLLPLALLSSFVDPMGIAVRTGGEFKDTWTGFKDGVRALAKGKEGQELLALLEEVGGADDFLPALAAHPVFDGSENAFSKWVNDRVFKWNGMQSWVMATRVMALHAGNKFLLKHAAKYDTDDTSRRYLDELSLTPADIVEDTSKPGRVVLNDKTREALRQFVDEAILRPNSTQVPLWHSDPYMGLVTQYKAFGYAIWDQIAGRIGREFLHGNYRVLLAALAYLPIALMAELFREGFQHGLDGNPNRKDWGAMEYTALAAERTGLAGPQAAVSSDLIADIKRRELPGTSQLGPSLGQAENIGDAIEGRRSLGKEFESALPASAAWKHWNNDSPPNDGIARRAA